MTEVPDGLRYTKTHEWVRVSGTMVVIGITDFAQEELHEVVYVELPEVGKQVQRGTEFAAVESVKARSEIFSPVSGKVAKINDLLIEGTSPAKPELLNEDPYGQGWLAEMELNDTGEMKELMSPDDYRKMIEKK